MTPGLERAGSAIAFPTARQYGWFALGFLAFAIYGSLVPLDFRPLAIAEALDRYRAAWQVPIRVESRSDWLSNILLFIPLGYLLSGWLAVDRRRWSVTVVAVSVPVASAALSSAIEYAQVYFPSRTVSPRDVVAETIGGAIGGAIWLAVGDWLTGQARSRAVVGGRAAFLLPLYLLAMVMCHVMPLDLIVSPGELYHKYTSGMINLVPFSAGTVGVAEFARRAADEAASFLIIGLLMSRADLLWTRGAWFLFSLGLVVAGGIEILQLFVASRRCDSTDMIIGSLAITGGWIAGRATLSRAAGRTRLVCFAGWMGLVATSSWLPFDSVADPGTWLHKASNITFLPFADYYRGSVLNAGDQVFRKSVMFAPLGMVSGWKGPWTLLSAATIATLLEAGQLALSSHEPSVTDIIVETGGAWLGHLSTRFGPSPAGSRKIGHPSAAGE